MEIQTKYHGVIEIYENEIIYFENGIPGFSEQDKFTIIPLDDEGTFLILQSLNSSNLAFVVVNPFNYFPKYNFTLEDSVVEKLGISSPVDVIVYIILTVEDPFENTTANLQAPIIINSKNQQAKQVVLNNDKYTTRHKILEKR